MAMAAQSVQISLPDDLLKEIDRRPETRERGRSAIIQEALRLYLEQVRKEGIDRAYKRAYEGRARELSGEFGPLIRRQRWPRK